MCAGWSLCPELGYPFFIHCYARLSHVVLYWEAACCDAQSTGWGAEHMGSLPSASHSHRLIPKLYQTSQL